MGPRLGLGLAIRGDPNALHGLFPAPAADPVSVPLCNEPVWVSGAVRLTAGRLDPLGVATHAIAVVNVPALHYSPGWCQAASGTLWPLRASTIAGGVVR